MGGRCPSSPSVFSCGRQDPLVVEGHDGVEGARRLVKVGAVALISEGVVPQPNVREGSRRLG